MFAALLRADYVDPSCGVVDWFLPSEFPVPSERHINIVWIQLDAVTDATHILCSDNCGAAAQEWSNTMCLGAVQSITASPIIWAFFTLGCAPAPRSPSSSLRGYKR